MENFLGAMTQLVRDLSRLVVAEAAIREQLVRPTNPKSLIKQYEVEDNARAKRLAQSHSVPPASE
jgi:hypothetical protein